MTRIGNTRLRILGMILSARLPPTVRELAQATGTNNNNVHTHLVALKRDGWIQWDTGSCRTLVPRCRYIPAENLKDFS